MEPSGATASSIQTSLKVYILYNTVLQSDTKGTAHLGTQSGARSRVGGGVSLQTWPLAFDRYQNWQLEAGALNLTRSNPTKLHWVAEAKACPESVFLVMISV